MSRTDPWPAREAHGKLRELGINTLPVDPLDITARCEIPCMGMPSADGGVSGILVRQQNAIGILYATHIDNLGFQRFSIAHELGHCFLPGHPEAVHSASVIHQSHAGFASNTRIELEADQYACGLLMPAFLVDRALDRAGTGLTAVRTLQELCGTSLTATAIRYAQRCEEPTAIVISSRGVIEYCFMSEELKRYPDLRFIRKGTGVPHGTRTRAFHADESNVRERREASGISDLASWFGGQTEGDLHEEVIGLGQYGKSLTILSGEDLPDPEDINEDDERDESWRPRFR